MTGNNTLHIPAFRKNTADIRPAIARTESDLFDEENPKRYSMWKKGQITNPKWLQRENGSDFITIKSEGDLADFEKYLAKADERLACEYYNTFSTGHDKAGNRIVGLYDQDETGDNRKIAFVCIIQKSLAMRVVELAEQFCGEEV